MNVVGFSLLQPSQSKWLLVALSLLAMLVPKEASAQQLPLSIDPVRVERLFKVRTTCREARAFDWVGLSGMVVLAGAGVATTAVSFATPSSQRTLTTSFLGAMGPGLILGAVGVPLGRGWFGGTDPLRTSCDGLLGEPDDATLLAGEGILHAYGAPPSLAVPLLLGGATLLTGGGIALGFALGNTELTQAMGGIAAAVATAWAVIPPTPPQLAARRYRASGRNFGTVLLQASVVPVPHGGLAVMGGLF